MPNGITYFLRKVLEEARGVLLLIEREPRWPLTKADSETINLTFERAPPLHPNSSHPLFIYGIVSQLTILIFT